MEEKNFFERNTGKANFSIGLGFGILGTLAVGFFVIMPVLLGSNNSQNGDSMNVGTEQPSVVLPTEDAVPQKQSFTITESDHYRGNFDAPVTLVEFSDFQCPYCSRFKATVKEIEETYGDQVRIVFKHFPLESIHPQAIPAAIATECAYEQKGNEGFYALHDAFYANQGKLGEEYYLEVASKNGLDMNAFEACLNDSAMEAKVDANMEEGIQKGVQGTPATFVNGELVEGAYPFETFKEIIDRELGL